MCFIRDDYNKNCIIPWHTPLNCQWRSVGKKTLWQKTIFPLWTFHLNVSTFQQHLHIKYIAISWSDTSELVVPMKIYICHKWPQICSTCRKNIPVLSSFMTFLRVCGFVTRVTRWVPLEQQEPLTLPEHLSSSLVFSSPGL